MKTTSISVTEAARNFADCVNRAHYQGATFVLLRNGSPVARLVPDDFAPDHLAREEKVCTGRQLAEALAQTELPPEEAKAWRRDLQRARKALKPPPNRWR